MHRSLLFIINPKAGRSKSNAAFFDAVCVFSDAGYDTHIMRTAASGDATAFARNFAADYNHIVCCGGDGTLNETVCGLMDIPNCPPLGYIPCGSTNDFAASLHLPVDPVSAAKVAIEGMPTAIDIGRWNDRHFVYVASFGAFTQASYAAPQAVKNALGHTAYMLEAVRQLPSLTNPAALQLVADGEDLSGEYLFGAISNSTSIGGFMKLSPAEVAISDGLYELLLVKNPKNPLELQSLATALLMQDYSHKGIVYRHISHLEFQTEDDVPWSLDGEFAPGCKHVTIDNLPRALTLMT